MIKVKVQTSNKRRFTIPVPYVFLHLCQSFLTSNFLWEQINKKIHEQSKKKAFPNITINPKIVKHFLTPILEEIQNYKGLVIVDVKLKDGTEVMVKI
ncbi:hypothetical protein KDN24_24225 [Bacillus sp. Bva_UNVM-123]|uniref:hypothetical protein n=1 Tax=Bacillus sp. Bva_UNVM-123 TaxID=2829798 RepID=UPI00391F58BC